MGSKGLREETEAINRSTKQSKLMGFTFDTTNVETEIAQISSVVTLPVNLVL